MATEKTQYELWSRELGNQTWYKVVFDEGDFNTLDDVLKTGRRCMRSERASREYKVMKVTVKDLGFVSLC